MGRCLLVLLLDAFRPDYLPHTRFLRHLAARGAKGRLVEPFGFSARPAYFGGLTPGEAGYSHVFWFDPDNSPFGPARYLGPSQSSTANESVIREAICRRARNWVTPYAASYLNTGRIPLERLHYFDFPERYAPFDPSVGYASIFSQLDHHGLPWYGAFWPLTNHLPNSSDEEILGAAIAALAPRHRFAFVHLSALDRTGHEYGPSSDEILFALDRIDRQVERLVEHCHGLFGRVDVVAFGDHGMVNVVQSIDLESRLRCAGLSHGSEYVAFYDSTMARFWCPTAFSRAKLAAALEQQPGGRLLTSQEKADWQITNCDPRNGELYFLADPGTVIVPNYFQGDGDSVRGMHGYAPEAADNKGIFILNDGQVKGDVGDVHATQLYHTFVDLLGMNSLHARLERSARQHVRAPSPDAPRYTFVLTRQEEAVIDDHLSILSRRINALDPSRDAIVLSGAFGRGEGSVARSNQRIRPLNDYDIVLITRTPLRRETLRREEQELAAALGIDFVDLGVIDTASLPCLRLTQFVFDLKYGSRIIAGDPTILDRIPRFCAGAIPTAEGLKLVFNRLAGLLNALPDYGLPAAADGKALDFCLFQLAKLWIAIADAYLILWRGYDTSYRVRRQRFADLHASGGVAVDVARAVGHAYEFKLGIGVDARNIEITLPTLLAVLPDTLERLAVAADQVRVRNDASLDETLDAWIRNSANPSERAVRETWSAITALVLSHIPAQRRTQLPRAAGLLSGGADGNYQALRRIAWKAWEEKCHH